MSCRSRRRSSGSSSRRVVIMKLLSLPAVAPGRRGTGPCACGRRGRRSCRVLLTGALFECSKSLCLFLQPFLSLAVRLPAPLGEPDPVHEDDEPEHPCHQQTGPPPAL